jgi:hypothetical protein
MRNISLLFGLVLLTLPCAADTIHVPGDYPFIQQAINAAGPGDEIIVGPGVYAENLDFLGKAVVLRSSHGPESTTLNGKNQGTVVTFTNGEGPDSVLEGFTLTQGMGTVVSPYRFGGGVYCFFSSPTLRHNIICGNGPVDRGGGIFLNSSSPVLVNNLIYDNAVTGPVYGNGGGLACWYYSSPVLTNNTIYGNTAETEGGGMWCHHHASPVVTNGIFWNNEAPGGPQIYVGSQSFPSILTISHSSVQGGVDGLLVGAGCTLDWGVGMISDDPGLLDPEGDDFHLLFTSPCVDSGDNDAPHLPDYDLEGEARIFDGNYDQVSLVDMGCDEFWPAIQVPTHFPTIQAAIDASSNGEVIAVLPGTYKENLDFLGKAITLVSANGPDVTVLDGGQNGSVVSFVNGEGKDSVLRGFKVKNGHAASGGGINCSQASPVMYNNQIIGNSATGSGGGVCLSDTEALLDNNLIQSNSCTGPGGGVYCRKGKPRVLNCTISNNTAGGTGGGICIRQSLGEIRYCNIFGNKSNTAGGGISCTNFAAPDIMNCMVHGNHALGESGGGLSLDQSSPVLHGLTVAGNTAAATGGGIYFTLGSSKVYNLICWGNQAPDYPEIHQNTANPDIRYSNIKGGWNGEGNVELNPRFVDPGQGDYHLTWRSPCINMGTDEYGPADDFDGDARPFQGTADIGADEFSGHLPLEADSIVIYESTGAKITFTLDAGAPCGGRAYLLLASASGSVPGTPLPLGKSVLPLNWDPLTDMTVVLANSPVFINFMGKLGPAGGAQAVLDAKGPHFTGLSGAWLRFAFTLAYPWEFASNPLPIEILP